MRFSYVLWSGMIVLLGLCPAPAFGQEPVPADTLQILDLPVLLAGLASNNPALRAARLDAEALGTRRRQVSALPDPTVSVVYQPYPLLTARGTQRSQWRVEQMIPFPGKLGLQGDVAHLSAEVVALEAETFEQDLLFEVKQAYYEFYRTQQQDALIRAFQDQLQTFEEAAATQYEVGAGLQQAILKAQLEKNTLSQRLLGLAEARRTAREMLARLLNQPMVEGPAIRLVPPPLPQLDEAALLQIAFQERPEREALEAAARRVEAQIALAQKQFMPDFGLSLTYFDVGAAAVPPTATGRDAVALGVSLKVPLQRGRLRAQLEEARVRSAQVEARQEALATAFQTQIADLVNRLRQDTQQLTLYREALLPQAETSLQATLSAYTTGRTGFLDLLDAERMLFSLRTGYEDTVARYLKTTAALERALGIPSLQDLETRL